MGPCHTALRAALAATLLWFLGTDAFAGRYVERLAGKGVCGNGAPGNGGPALDACLGLPAGVAVDGAGTVYFAEVLRGAIRRITPSGVIDQLPLPALSQPGAIAFDGSGGLFVATAGDSRIYHIDLSTNATTHIAGNGSTSPCGDGGLATAACIGTPAALAVHGGKLYLADSTNHRVRQVDLGTGPISTFAGNGTNLADRSCPALGDGLAAGAACLSMPAGVAVDSGGNVFIADNGNHRVRRVLAATGNIETFAGTGDHLPCDESLPASSACIPYPGPLAIDASDALYVSEAVVLPPGLGGPPDQPTPFPGTALLVRITSAAAPAERITGTLPCSGNPEGLAADADCSMLGFGLAVAPSGGSVVYSGGLSNVVREIVDVPEAPLPAAFRAGLVPPTPRVSDTERRADGVVRTFARDLSKCFVKGVRGFLGGNVVGCDIAVLGCSSDAECPFGQRCAGGPPLGLCECSASRECAPGYTCDGKNILSGFDFCLRGCSVSLCLARAQASASERFGRADAPACAFDAVAGAPLPATQRNLALWCEGAEPLPAEFTNGQPGGAFPATKAVARATTRLARLGEKLAGDARRCFERGVGAVVAGYPDGVSSCLALAEEKFLRRAQGLSGLPACVDAEGFAAMVLEQEGDRNGSLYCE